MHLFLCFFPRQFDIVLVCYIYQIWIDVVFTDLARARSTHRYKIGTIIDI